MANETNTIELSTIKLNPNNPRTIDEDRFKKIVKSIKEFPKMLNLRPLVVNNDNIVLGGNMRLKALQELEYKIIPEAWVKKADELTEEEQRRFIIADNVAFGEHDWEMLKSEWDTEELEDWGLELNDYEEFNEIDYSDKNQEIDVDEFSDKMTLKLDFDEDEFTYVNNELSKINANKENAILKLLNYE